MDARLSRRSFVAASLAGTTASIWPFRSRAEGRPPLTATALTPKLIVVGGAGANVTIHAGERGAVLVDGGIAQRAEDVLGVLEAFTGSRAVARLFDTSWRPEHSGANARLRAAGAAVLAHENTKHWLGTTFAVPWEHRKHAAQPAAALPTETVAADGRINVAGLGVAYGHVPYAHTDGDLYVRFPDANVLAVGELLAVGRYPVVDYVTGGWIGGLAGATRKLLERADSGTRIVPAYGAVQGRAALEDQLRLCMAMLEAVGAAYARGHSFAEFAAAQPTTAFDAERGDPSLFLRLVYEGAGRHRRELEAMASGRA